MNELLHVPFFLISVFFLPQETISGNSTCGCETVSNTERSSLDDIDVKESISTSCQSHDESWINESRERTSRLRRVDPQMPETIGPVLVPTEPLGIRRTGIKIIVSLIVLQ